MNFAVFVLIAAAAFWSLLGLGGVCCRIIGYRAGTWTETVGIGLAGLICVGGVFNLCRISYGPLYDGLLLTGMIAAFLVVPRKGSGLITPPEFWYNIALTALSTGALWLIGHAAIPPSAYSDHDDFEKYLVHPVRMLQTGTVFGSPLSAIGAETLGGQAVLHEIVVHHFGIPYLFAVDGLFALLLCLLMVQAVVPKSPKWILVALLGIVTACVVNPVMINVSSIYTTCVLIMTVLLVCRSLYEREAECLKQSSLPLLLGMLFAALLALKSINAVYLLAVFATAVAVQYVGPGRNGIEPGHRLKVFATIGATILFAMPWLLVHSPNYRAIATASINGDSFAPMGSPYPEPLDLFSFYPLFYGSSYAHYTLVTLIVVMYSVGLYLLTRKRVGELWKFRGWLFACCAALPITTVLILALGPLLNGYETNIRYTTPFLIAGSSMLLPITMYEAGKSISRKTRLWSTVMLLCGVCVIGLYAESFVSRVQQTSRFGNSLAFRDNATDPQFLAYNREVLYGKRAGQMRMIQGLIPAGASVLAWVMTPHHLDFSRNQIYDVEQAGVGNPWSHIPKVDYVMYQYAGYAVPSLELIYYDLHHPGRRERHVGRNSLAVIDAINNLWNVSPELYNDGETVVFKVLVKRFE